MYNKIKHKLDIQIIRNGSAAELQGVFIIPVYMSKGLEFDAVLICDADNQNYYDEDDKISYTLPVPEHSIDLAYFVKKKLAH